ncbi:hypothetical protein MHBO_003155 [Bonamia ostreae]|uniref:Uncharacterized protein n=1 Tax=Bonamia ostreae TaxID=126728 RepID=A0ABV2APM6_9EUKA
MSLLSFFWIIFFIPIRTKTVLQIKVDTIFLTHCASLKNGGLNGVKNAFTRANNYSRETLGFVTEVSQYKVLKKDDKSTVDNTDCEKPSKVDLADFFNTQFIPLPAPKEVSIFGWVTTLDGLKNKPHTFTSDDFIDSDNNKLMMFAMNMNGAIDKFATQSMAKLMLAKDVERVDKNYLMNYLESAANITLTDKTSIMINFFHFLIVEDVFHYSNIKIITVNNEHPDGFFIGLIISAIANALLIVGLFIYGFFKRISRCCCRKKILY